MGIFRLNNNSEFSTEICQLIKPVTTVEFENSFLKFISGHGRLKWRAESLLVEEPLMIDWIRTFSYTDIFLDIGANVGMYTVPAATRCAQVFAIELDPSNLFFLHNNLILNNLEHKCIILPFAAGSDAKLESIFYRDISVGDALQSVGREQLLKTHKPNPHVVTQIAFPLDYLFHKFVLPQPTRIKIDVDGNEELVISGAKDLLRNSSEIYYEDNNFEFDKQFRDMMYTWGFRATSEHITRSSAKNILFKKT